MMVSEPIDLPKDLVDRMKEHPEINWEEIIEKSLRSHLELIEHVQAKKGWKEEFIQNFCGVIKGEVEEIDNVKGIWVPTLEE